jgi:hypothetical protein
MSMKKLAAGFAVTVGIFVFALGGATAGADPAINCAGLGNPGQATQSLGAAGRDRVQTPPELAASLGQPSVGATIQTFCVTPADSHP